MKDNALSKLGGTLSILVGVSYVIIGIAYALVPADQKPGAAAAQLLVSLAQNPTWLLIEFWAFALGALLAIGAVLAISETVRGANEGWLRWASNLAVVGFALTAINYFRLLAIQPIRAAAYVAGDATTKAALVAEESSLNLDPQGWLGFGAVGLWVMVVSLLALRGSVWPKPLVYLGIAVAVAYWLVVAGFVLRIETLILIAASLGGIILGPIWYIWAGVRLRQASG